MGFCPNFCQSNESYRKGAIRGLICKKNHFRSKLVRVVSGEVIDVVIDCRKGSKLGEHVRIGLDSTKKSQVWVPRGCAHGFQVISDYCILSYHVDAPYHPESQISIDAFDKVLGIEWQKTSEPIMSAQDESAMSFSDVIDSIER